MSIEEKIARSTDEFEKMPGVTVIHSIDGFKPLFMSSNGLKLLDLSLEELIAVKENYQNLFFNKNFMGDYLEKLLEMISRDGNTETYTFFHQVKLQEEFRWYAASIKVFHVDPYFNPTHTITYAVPLEDYEWTMKRAQRLLEETEFARKNLKKFSLLTPREMEVLARVGAGKRPSEMAEEFNVSLETVNSHLKAMRKKLDVSTPLEVQEYAMAYDLL